MVIFSLCKKSCLTCSCIVEETEFHSAANGQKFTGIYSFEDKEPHVLNCKSVNVIYMLQCVTCNSQYIGETVQELKDRMSDHRKTTSPGKTGGNYRLRQHFACSLGVCQTFKIFIIQKLCGSGRMKELKDNSKLYKIDPSITQIRKEYEDDWIRTFHTQYPYGCNDRIDSLKNKSMFNCTFAMFKSVKSSRQRTWNRNRNSSSINVEIIVNKLIEFLNHNFSVNFISDIKRILFPLKKDTLVTIRDLYLDKVFSDVSLKHEILRNHMHFIITDLLMYKIKPYNNDNVLSKPMGSKKKVNFNLLFVNKAMDMINLPRIFRDQSLKSYVSFCSIKQPSIVYSFKSSISSNIFNYNDVVKEFASIESIHCNCNNHVSYINSDCNHVATGDMSIFSNSKLRNIIKNGPNFREPVTLDFDLAYETILNNIDNLIDKWSNKEKLPKLCFNGWKQRFIGLLVDTINELKVKHNRIKKVSSVFADPSVKTELEYFKKYFVICPVDKANKNVAIICKSYYLSKILNECVNNTLSYESVDDSISNILKTQEDYLVRLGINTDDLTNNLPHIFLLPKFHKPQLSQRFVVSYYNCFIKPLAKVLTTGLKAIYFKICSYSNMMYKVTGIKRNWIIKNNEPLLQCLGNYLESERARNIQTYDFTTLYTNLKHDEIKIALTSVIKLAFKQSKCKYISIYSNSFSWTNKPRDSTLNSTRKLC